MYAPPSETLTLLGGQLSPVREVDDEQMALAVHESLQHLRPWMPWATAAAARVEAQLTWSRKAERQWLRGSDFLYALRPHTSDVVIGAFGLHRRVGPDALEIGYWVHVDWIGRRHMPAPVPPR